MALTYRTPMEDIVISFDPQVQAEIANSAAKVYKKVEEENCHLFNFYLSALAKQKLSRAGIYLSPFSAIVHSHPVCKTLENYMLYSALPNYIDNRFFFVGIKDRKLQLLKARSKKMDTVQCINRYVTSADKLRYTNDFVCYNSVSHEDLKRHGKGLDEPALRGIVGPLLRHKAKYLFFHDELHYWKSDTLCNFLQVVQPEVLIASIVYPPELLFKQTRSLNGWCYTFEIKGNCLLFYPDGVRSEGYEQPLSGGYLLNCNKIVLKDGTCYMVDVLCSKFAHHLVALTRGEAVAPRHRSFGPFEATASSHLSTLCPSYKVCLPVPHEVVNKLYRYLRTLKKPDVQSAMAKLSQIVSDPSGTEIDFMEDFAKLIINNGTMSTTINPECIRMLVTSWLGRFPSFFVRNLDCVKKWCLSEFIKGLEPYNFTVELKTIRWNTLWEDVQFWVAEESKDECDLLKLMERFENGSAAVIERPRAPYAGVSTDASKGGELLLQGFHKLLLPYLRSVYINDWCCATTRKISKPEVETFLKSRLRNNFLICCVDNIRPAQRGFTHWQLYESLGVADLEALISQIEARMKSRRRGMFSEFGLCWFIRADRYNMQYICERPDGTGVNKALEGAWKKVTSDVVSLKARVHYVQLQETSAVVEVTEVIVASTQVPVGLTKAQSSLKCGCGCSMPLMNLEWAEDVFSAPDVLKKRLGGWYSKDGTGYAYTGGVHKSQGWPDAMQLWCEANLVPEKYNSCLYQVYEEGANIGFHADDEDCFVDGESILTVNLRGAVSFKVKCSGSTGEVRLQGPCAFEMPPGFQGTHKHSVVGCTKGRASLTFRCLKRPTKLAPEICGALKCSQEQSFEGYTTTLGGVKVSISGWRPNAKYNVIRVPGDGSCFWHAVGLLTGVLGPELKKRCVSYDFGDEVLNQEIALCKPENAYANDAGIIAAAICLNAKIRVWNCSTRCIHEYACANFTQVCDLQLENEHFEPMQIRNGCVIRSLADALQRSEGEIRSVIEEKCAKGLLDEIWSGDGLQPLSMELLFATFDVAAHVAEGEREVQYNPLGSMHLNFTLREGHISYNPRKKEPCGRLLQGCTMDKRFPESTISELQRCGTMVDFIANLERAGVLADSMHNACTGVLGSALFNNAGNLRAGFADELCTQNVCVIFGTFGAGKSTLFRKLLALGHGKIFDYVSPRKALVEEFREVVGMGAPGKGKKVGQENWSAHTFEVFLRKLQRVIEGQVIIFDEFQLYPPGYFDLVCATVPFGVKMFFVGDPAQSDYDSDKDRLVLSGLDENCDALMRGRTYNYNIKSRRFRNANFIGRLPCVIDPEECTVDQPHELRMYAENFKSVEEKYTNVVLVSSFDEKMVVRSFLPKARILTFGESTGLTFTYGTIYITQISEHTSDKRWLTALSRFSMNVCLMNCSGTSFEMLARRYIGKPLGRFLCKTAVEEDLKPLLPGEPKFSNSFTYLVGKDEGIREEKMAGDPWLKTMINLYQAPDVTEEVLIEEAIPAEWFRTHLPRDHLESVRAQWVHRILAKEEREVRMGDMVSTQFTDEHSKQVGARQLTNAAERFETIYPRHRANDTVTFIMAVRKRLSFSNPARERAKLFNASLYGKSLLNEFLKHVPLKPMHNKEFMDRALWEFEEKKLSKSAATIENHSGRSCRDWPIDMAMLFSKSQLCTKFDNRFRVAKAAQSIVCFQHAVLCRFAPYMRYIEMKVHEVLPHRFYIHSGKGLEELNDWVMRGKFDGKCTESDYEAFDASQDEFIMAFEIELMKFLRLPNDLIEDYKFIKTSLGSKLGNFAIMRFSGEASTFLFNTLANMLFTFMRYEIKGDEFICFAGDDMCASRELKIVSTHKKFLDKLKLKAKVQFTHKPTFCGWHLCPDGIYKKPQLVLERMCIAMELNNLSNCIDNYAIEVAFAYKLGERAMNRMDEEEVSAFYNCVRLIVRNKHLLKSDVRTVFEDSVVS